MTVLYRRCRDGILRAGGYADGKKCGHWTQYDAVTGVKKEWDEDASGEL